MRKDMQRKDEKGKGKFWFPQEEESIPRWENPMPLMKKGVGTGSHPSSSILCEVRKRSTLKSGHRNWEIPHFQFWPYALGLGPVTLHSLLLCLGNFWRARKAENR